MRLDELKTPLERRRAIVYNASGKPVRHWFEVRPIALPFYMGNLRQDHGENVYDLFMFLPDVGDGVIIKPWIYEDRYDLECYQKSAELSGVHDKDSYIGYLNHRIASGGFIDSAQIEFVLQWDKEQAARYAQYRTDYYTKQEQSRIEKKLEEDKKRQEAEAQKANEDKAERAKYLGWADKMPVLRFAKVNAYMDSIIRNDGKLVTRRDFVISCVRDGWMPEKREGVTHWYGRWEPKETKPRTEYYLRKDNLSYTISKTEYAFAAYIMEHLEAVTHG